MYNKRIQLVVFILIIIIGVFITKNKKPDFEFVPNDVSVTIPEGTNLADTERLILAKGIDLQGRLLTKENLSLEGYLFPDTYRFDLKSSSQDVIERMKKSYDDSESVIIASLLEKEVRTESDMRIVSGIIRKRIKAGMAIQIDASVAYGACLPMFVAGKYCEVSKVNLVDNIKRDSAYNTYTNTGLPPGPISNPGEMSLFAARNPVVSEYWYYLSTREGITVFSKTLDEHNTAKSKYLR